MDWTELLCDVDDFFQWFEPRWRKRQIERGQRKRRRSSRLALSEIMTILIALHASGFRTFKHFYLMSLSRHRADFPHLVSCWAILRTAGADRVPRGPAKCPTAVDSGRRLA